MGLILEIRGGAAAGKVVGLTKGRSVTVGRAAGRAEFALEHDTFMSGVHFAVECGASGCRVVDRKSSNGTFLNGAKIQDALLANGDEIKAGQTVFHVKIVADEKIAAMNLSPATTPPAPPSRAAEPSAAAPSERIAPERVSQGELPRHVAQPPRPEPQEPLPPAEDLGRESKKVGEPSSASAESMANSFSRGVEPFLKSRAALPELPAGVQRPPLVEGPTERSASRPAARASGFGFRVMGWSFPTAPAEWQVQEGFGLQRTGEDEFPSSVAASEEALAGITLQEFVESQISMLRSYLRDAKIEPTMPPRVEGADESMGVDVLHSTKDGRELAYRHIYARNGSSVGVLTVTTLASEFPLVLASLQPLLKGATFQATLQRS